MQSPIVVTGGTGFIGRALINELLAQGLEVANFALPGQAAPSHWGNRVKIHRGDLTLVMRKLLQKFARRNTQNGHT